MSCATTGWGFWRQTTSETFTIRLTFYVLDIGRGRRDDDGQQGDDREKSEEEILHVEMGLVLNDAASGVLTRKDSGICF
jgi:hypothetical protein